MMMTMAVTLLPPSLTVLLSRVARLPADLGLSPLAFTMAVARSRRFHSRYTPSLLGLQSGKMYHRGRAGMMHHSRFRRRWRFMMNVAERPRQTSRPPITGSGELPHQGRNARAEFTVTRTTAFRIAGDARFLFTTISLSLLTHELNSGVSHFCLCDATGAFHAARAAIFPIAVRT